MRLFLAIPLPDAIREQASALTHGLALDPSSWRVADPSGLHLTLRFLGEVADDAALRQDPAWRRTISAFAPIPLEVGGCGFFPAGGRSRVVWVGIHDRSGGGTLAALAAALEGAARAEGFAPERRRFAPHATLARARRPAPTPVLPPGTERTLGAFVAGEVVLFRSVTAPAGARYVALRAYALDAA